jgi:hypothetical protein
MVLIFIVHGHRDQWPHNHFLLLASLLIRCLILSPTGISVLVILYSVKSPWRYLMHEVV